MGIYTKLIRPVLFLFPPERVHNFTFKFLRLASAIPGLLSGFSRSTTNHSKPISLMGLEFKNCVGLAAGLDKNGEAMHPMSKLGFGFLEVGTVTPKAQPGNPKPRSFRLLKDKALINRMGFNNHGVDSLVTKLKNRPKGIIIGGNIGKNTATPNSEAVDDYAYCFEKLFGYVDYFVVNVSCPNISDLRELQDKDSLSEILEKLLEIRKRKGVFVPILLKVSPDLNRNQLNDLIEVVKSTAIDGLVATNTSVGRENLVSNESIITNIGKGGLSGKPISSRSSQIVRILREAFPKPFPIIASGGIMSREDALNRIENGADLVQIYTGFVYEGPGLIKQIIKNQ